MINDASLISLFKKVKAYFLGSRILQWLKNVRVERKQNLPQSFAD
jgi:hypothetical protein